MHLFAGIGGGLLADVILDHSPVCAVELNPYCCQLLRERVEDGWFPGMHVHEGDVREFDFTPWNGRVDQGNILTHAKILRTIHVIQTKGECAMSKGPERKQYLDEAAKMYEAGLSIGEISKYYGVSRQSLYQCLKLRGVNFRSQTRTGKENHFYRGGSIGDKRSTHLVERAIAKGLLIRPDKCQECNQSSEFKDGRPSIQAHHDDYNKPLDVRWLCQGCHHKWHQENTPVSFDPSIIVVADTEQSKKIGICEFCGEEFEKKNSRQACCNRSCANSLAWKKRKAE